MIAKKIPLILKIRNFQFKLCDNSRESQQRWYIATVGTDLFLPTNPTVGRCLDTKSSSVMLSLVPTGMLQIDKTMFLTLRLAELVTVVTMLTLHKRSLRVFRWEQSVSGGILVTYTIVSLGLCLCAGDKRGGRIFQVTENSLFPEHSSLSFLKVQAVFSPRLINNLLLSHFQDLCGWESISWKQCSLSDCGTVAESLFQSPRWQTCLGDQFTRSIWQPKDCEPNWK